MLNLHPLKRDRQTILYIHIKLHLMKLIFFAVCSCRIRLYGTGLPTNVGGQLRQTDIGGSLKPECRSRWRRWWKPEITVLSS